jgi:hypothetical protein
MQTQEYVLDNERYLDVKYMLSRVNHSDLLSKLIQSSLIVE